MTALPDDTELDLLASQVRSIPKLDPSNIGSLLDAAQAGDRAAQARLVEQQLGTVLDSALAHRPSGIDVVELFQEGSVAATMAVDEYVTRHGRPSGLRDYAVRVVNAHLDFVVEREALQRQGQQGLIKDTEMLELAQVALRRELGRAPTAVETATRLDWPPDRVDAVGQMLVSAREIYDREIAQYLDDEIDDNADDE